MNDEIEEMGKLEAEVSGEIISIDTKIEALEDRKKSFFNDDPRCIELKELMKKALEEFYVLPGVEKGKVNTQHHLFNHLITRSGFHGVLMRTGKKIKEYFPDKPHVHFSSHADGFVTILIPYEDDEKRNQVQSYLDDLLDDEVGDYNLIVRVEPSERIKRY